MQWRVALGLAAAIGMTSATAARAQIEEDWIVFVDSETDARCGLVNTASDEFIALFEDGVMVRVSGPDTLFEDLVVTDDFSVLFQGQPAGFIEYAEDGDGLPTVFWFTDQGTIIEFENGAPVDSGLDPTEIFDTGCDACEQIDSSSQCDDGPGNGGGGGGGGGNGGGGGDIPFPFPFFCGAGALPMALATMLGLGVLRRLR